jgi:hypothetical protein
MNNLLSYLLLTALCINLFGASVGELVHMAAHFTEGTHLQWHTHHGDEQAHLHLATQDAHTHHQTVSFLLKAFDIHPDHTPLNDFLHLNLLLIAIDGIFSTEVFKLNIPVNRAYLTGHQKNPLKTAQSDIPTPPPRLFA